MVVIIDVALAAQNATLAAESMGLGACYIGGLRNELEEVSKLLKLPHHVIPLFGLTVGHPAGMTDKSRAYHLNMCIMKKHMSQTMSRRKRINDV